MNANEQYTETPLIHISLWLLMSVLSALGGWVMLVTLTGFSTLAISLGIFLLVYIILVACFRNRF